MLTNFMQVGSYHCLAVAYCVSGMRVLFVCLFVCLFVYLFIILRGETHSRERFFRAYFVTSRNKAAPLTVKPNNKIISAIFSLSCRLLFLRIILSVAFATIGLQAARVIYLLLLFCRERRGFFRAYFVTSRNKAAPLT